MINYQAIGYNETGRNFVDILILMSLHFSKAAGSFISESLNHHGSLVFRKNLLFIFGGFLL